MKLHLPVKLRSAVLSCMTALATIGTTAVTATMAGGAFSLVIASTASAENLTIEADTTWQIDEDHSQDTTTVNGVTLTISGKAANNSTDYNFGDITVTNGGKLVLPNSPGASSASDSANAVGTDAKLQIASDITLEEGSTLDCDAISFYLKNPLTIVGSDTMNIRWSKSFDFEGLVGDADAQFNISLASHGWADYSLVRVLDENATYKGKIALTNASNATMSLLGGGERTFASAAIDLGSNTRLLLGNASVQVRNLTGSGSVELCPQDYVPTSEMTVPGAATLVVSNGSGTYAGSFGDNVSLNLTGGSLTLQGQTLDATRLSVAQGATLTLSGVTLDGTSLQGEGNYAFSGNITLTGDFGEIQDGTVLFAGSNVTAADGTVFTLSGTKVGWDTSAAYVAGKGVVVSNTVTQLAFATETISNVSYDILYTKSLGATISYNAETNEYTAQYVSGDGQTYSISGGAQTGNGLVVVGTDAIGAMPEAGMTLEVTSGTYQGLSFTRVGGSTVGTLGTAEEKAQLTLNILGDASVSNFIDGGQGLLGWSNGSSAIVFNSDITANVNTSGSVAWINLTGESNYVNSMSVNGDLTATILSGTIGKGTVGEGASLASGAKGMIINGNSTFTIGEVGTTGPTIEGSIVGGIVQRDGGATGSMTGDVVININSGSIAGNIYATGSKATLNGNYTVNYSGGTLGGKIAVTAGGTVTGTKTLNICGTAVLDTTQFEYTQFDKVTIAENAQLNMVGDVTLGVTELENNGTIDFAGVTSVALELTGLTGTETVSDDGLSISAEYIVLQGGTLTNTAALSALNPSFSYDGDKLVYSTTVNVNGWDVNWGVGGLADAPDLAALPGVSTITANTWLGNDAAYINANGDVQIRVTGGGGTGVNLYGGKQDTAFSGDTWLSIEGGTWGTIVGGTNSNSAQASFTGSSHIMIDGATVDHVYGGIHADAGSPVMTGNTYVSIKEGSVVNGWIAGGNVSWHNGTTKLVGNTNVWVYEVLTGEMAPSNQNGPASANTAIIGGNAWLRNTVCNTSIEGSTNLNVLLGANAAAGVESPTFGKLIVGGTLIGASSGSSTGSISGSTNVTIDTSDCTKNITFSKNIIGGAFLTGGSSAVTYTQGGGSNMSIAGNSVFNGMVILGCYVTNNQSATISGDSTLTVSGGTFKNLVIGGMYESSGSSTVVSGDIELNLNGGTYDGNIVGGHYTTGTGTVAVTAATTGDITVNIGSNAVVNGTICGGTVLQRTSGQATGFSQGNVTVNLEEGSTINGNIYAAGGDVVTGAATAALITESTRVAIADGVNLKDGITISGGYVGLGNSAGSKVTGYRTLALTGTGAYDLSEVTLTDFDTVEVTDAEASVNMGVSLSSAGIINKTGAGTYQLMDGDQAGDLAILEGTLKLSSDATMTSLTVSKGATLDATSGAVSTDLTLGEGSTLKLGSSALNLGTDKTLTLGSDLTLDVTGVDASDSVELVSGLASVKLGTTSMETGKWMSASDYFSSVVLGGTSISDALLKLEDNTLVVTDAKNAALYWEGASNGTWGGQNWAATPGGTDLGSFLSGTQVFFESNTQQEVVLVDQAATAYDITVNGDYRFDDAGGSLAVSNTLNVGSAGKADFGVAVDLSEATAKVENGGELTLTGETSIKDLQNDGSTQVNGNLSIGAATSGAGSLAVTGNLTLTGDTNSFGSLNVTGSVNSAGTINLTGAADTESSIGTLSGASITSTNAHKLTLTGASSTMSNLSLAEGSTLTLASGAALTVVDSVSGGRIDVTLADGLNATSSQLTLGGLTSGATINFTDATKDTFDTLFAAGASSVVLAQLTSGAQIDGSLLLDGQTSLATSDGNLYKVVVGTNSIYVYYAHSGLIWDSAGASESWQLAGAWDGDSAAPTAGDNVVFNGQGSDTVVLGNGAVANNVYIESEQGDKIYTFTDGDLTADGTIHVTSGTLAIADDASVKADGVEVTTGNLTVMGSLDAGQMTANAVTLDGSGSLTLGDGSNVEQVLAGASASGTSLNVSDGSVTVGTAEVDRVTVAGGAVLGAGSLTVEGVSVGNGSTLNADSLTLTGTSSTNAGSINAGTLSVLTGGNNLGALTTDNLSFSDVGEAGATDAVLTVSSIASVTSGQGIALDFSGLNVSRDGSYYLVSCMYGTDATFALTQEAVNYLSTLRFDARLETSADGSSVKLVLSTLGEMVWRTALDTDETGSYTIPLSGDDMYRGLEPIQYVVVNGDKTLDYTQADPSSALVSSLGAVVRNMSGVAGYTLTFVGNDMADDLVTFINDEGDSVGAHTIAGRNITLQVGADASDLAALVDKGILEGTPQNHALTVGGVTLEASRLEVSDAEGVKFTTGTLDGDEQSVISGTIHINGAGGEYAGSGENATIVLEQGAGQIFTNGSGITLTGSAGVAGVEGATLGGLATTGADVVLMAPAEGDPIVPVNLETSSSMTGGMLEVTVDEENVLAGKGGDNAIFSGESISLQGTQLVLNSSGSGQSMVADVDLSKTDGFVITQIHVDGEDLGSASGVSVTFNGGLLGKYFGNATVQGNQIVASRNTSYYVSAAASTPNGSAGLALADGALVAFNPQAGTNSATHPDLAGVLNSLDAAIAAGDRAGADRLGAIFAGAEAAGMGMAFSNDMDRQLRAIRNRTTTMGVGDEYVNPEMPYFNAWINAEGDYQQVKRDGTTPGYTLSSWGGTLGADVDFTPHFTAGLAVTAMYGDYQSESNGMAEGDLDSYYVTLFGRYSGNSAWVHTFVASVGMADASLKRTVTHANGSYTAEGDTTGMGFGLLYELGYTIALNEEATTCLQPVLNLSYVHTTLDGYRESGSDAALNFGNQKMDTFTAGLGARLQTLVGENVYNRTSMFESRALLKFTTGDRSSSMHTALASLPSMKSRVESEEQGAIGVELGAGLSVPLGADSGTLFIDGSLEAYTSYTNVNATVGWRINF